LKTAGSDPNEAKNTPARQLLVLTYALETHGLAAKIAKDEARVKLANATVEQYATAEIDKAKMTTHLLNYANNMNEAAEYKNAAAAFRKILETSPDNLDALAGLGLALYTDGSISEPPDKAALQEGLNYMQKFADTAPDTHRLKADIKATIEELKNVQKLAPQKTTPPRKKG
jgi:TPR repeat protein